jgi:hypothetical protein
VTFDAGARRRLATVADHLIPAGYGMPAASDVGVHLAQLDAVLAARPDLVAAVADALDERLADDPAQRLADLARDAPATHASLLLVIVAAYYMHPSVKTAIGYPGQEARPVNVLDYPDWMVEDLLAPVVARGPIWRDPDRADSDPRE